MTASTHRIAAIGAIAGALALCWAEPASAAAAQSSRPGKGASGPALAQRHPIVVTIKTDRTAYASGATVLVHATALNGGRSVLRVVFPTSQRFNLYLYRGGRSPRHLVWSWARDKAFSDLVSFVTLAPGQAVRFDAAIGLKSDPPFQLTAGKYLVVAALTPIGPGLAPTGAAPFRVR